MGPELLPAGSVPGIYQALLTWLSVILVTVSFLGVVLYVFVCWLEWRSTR